MLRDNMEIERGVPMDDLIIYKSLSFLKADEIVTSDQLLKKRFFRGCSLDSVNVRYSDLLKMGYCVGNMKGGVISLRLTPSGVAFLSGWKYRRCVNVRNAVISYAAGLLSGALLTYLAFLLSA